MADEADVANDYTERMISAALAGRQTAQEVGNMQCTDCGCDNGARAKIGSSRCIDCQSEFEMQYARYKVR